MGNENISKNIYILWILMIIVVLCLGVLLLGLQIGHGRWVCVENETYCKSCDVGGSVFIKDNLFNVSGYWQTVGDACVCVQYETRCVKEVFTRTLTASQT